MKSFLFLLLAPFFVMAHPRSPIDPGVARGSLRVNEKNVTLRYAYAHLHDNAEGLLDKAERFRVLFTDREVPANALDGIAFLPVMELAKQGRVQGLMFEMAPDDPDHVVMTLLLPPAGPGGLLVRHAIKRDGGGL